MAQLRDFSTITISNLGISLGGEYHDSELYHKVRVIVSKDTKTNATMGLAQAIDDPFRNEVCVRVWLEIRTMKYCCWCADSREVFNLYRNTAKNRFEDKKGQVWINLPEVPDPKV